MGTLKPRCSQGTEGTDGKGTEGRKGNRGEVTETDVIISSGKHPQRGNPNHVANHANRPGYNSRGGTNHEGDQSQIIEADANGHHHHSDCTLPLLPPLNRQLSRDEEHLLWCPLKSPLYHP